MSVEKLNVILKYWIYIQGVPEKTSPKSNDDYFLLYYRYSFFMNSFLILMFFKEVQKKNWSFNHIISKDIYK